MKRRVAFLIFPDFQLLDAAGPISAFEIAERYAPGTYELRVIAKQPGAVTSTSGASMNAVSMGLPRSIDTLIVVGGEGTRAMAKDERTVRFVAACGANVPTRGERLFGRLHSRRHGPARWARRHHALDAQR